VVEHPVGVRQLEREAENAVLTGLCAGGKRHQARRCRRGKRADQFIQPTHAARQHRGEQRRVPGQFGQQVPAHAVDKHQRDATYVANRLGESQPIDRAVDPEQRRCCGQHVAHRTHHAASLAANPTDPAIGCAAASPCVILKE
jgi:hypothetical protein